MSEENLERVQEGVCGILTDLQQHGPTVEEVNQTLSQIRSELLLSMENTHNRMNNNARHLIYMGRIVTVDETLEEIQKVTIEDMMQYLETYCKPDLQSITLIGNPGENEFM